MVKFKILPFCHSSQKKLTAMSNVVELLVDRFIKLSYVSWQYNNDT